MIKFLDKNMPFLAQTITVTLAGMTFLLGFSRMTAIYEISILYVALGFVCLMWVMYRFFERGVGGDK
jgi:hypothetical protein